MSGRGSQVRFLAAIVLVAAVAIVPAVAIPCGTVLSSIPVAPPHALGRHAPTTAEFEVRPLAELAREQPQKLAPLTPTFDS